MCRRRWWRAGWLLGLVSHPHPRYDGTRQGDLLTVLTLGGGAPWNVAAVAMVLVALLVILLLRALAQAKVKVVEKVEGKGKTADA